MEKENQIIARAYKVIADLFCNPVDQDHREAMKEAQNILPGLQNTEPLAASWLQTFLDNHGISEEEYIDLFELSPQCALYLGSHSFEEPETCSESANSDRNKYMIQITNIYKHYGLQKEAYELPDYLPMMIEFMAFTTDYRDDELRRIFIDEYFAPFIEPVYKQLAELDSNYPNLCKSLESLLMYDLDPKGLIEKTAIKDQNN